jgi:hypothetical protein
LTDWPMLTRSSLSREPRHLTTETSIQVRTTICVASTTSTTSFPMLFASCSVVTRPHISYTGSCSFDQPLISLVLLDDAKILPCDNEYSARPRARVNICQSTSWIPDALMSRAFPCRYRSYLSVQGVRRWSRRQLSSSRLERATRYQGQDRFRKYPF